MQNYAYINDDRSVLFSVAWPDRMEVNTGTIQKGTPWGKHISQPVVMANMQGSRSGMMAYFGTFARQKPCPNRGELQVVVVAC